jgi:hypothetical protein
MLNVSLLMVIMVFALTENASPPLIITHVLSLLTVVKPGLLIIFILRCTFLIETCLMCDYSVFSSHSRLVFVRGLL